VTLFEFLRAEATDDGLTAEITRDDYGAYEGAFGGLVAALSLAAARRVAEGRRPVSLDARFLRRLEAGGVHARAEVVRSGLTLTTVEVTVTDSHGVPCAVASTSFVDPTTLQDVDDAAMVRPGASVAYAEATPFQLRRRDVPIIGTLGPRVALTAPGLVATVLPVPWDEPGTAPEASCLAADMSVGPPVARDLDSDAANHPNGDLSLRFCADDAGPEIAGVARLERISAGVATVRMEVFSGVELLAVGCASSLLLRPLDDLAPPPEPTAGAPDSQGAELSVTADPSPGDAPASDVPSPGDAPASDEQE
jgi:acyl-coenzyme A thioesterase PaaI-like protein